MSTEDRKPVSPELTAGTQWLDPEDDARYIEAQQARYDETLKTLTGRLRRLADRMDQEGQRLSTRQDGKVDYLAASDSVVGEFMGGMGALNLAGYLVAAADAHSAVRGRLK